MARPTEFAALNGDEDVSVLGCWRHEFCHDILVLLASTHAKRLEALKTVLFVNFELL